MEKAYLHLGPVYLEKRLAAALAAAGLAAVVAVCGPPWDLLARAAPEPPAYRWSDRALSGYTGLARVTDDTGTVRYDGALADGACTGAGRVYDAAGALVYEGLLADGRYEDPDGREYQNGRLVYAGGFAAGVYEGKGRLIRPTGEVWEGDFASGAFTGEGCVRAASGALLREGSFADGLLSGAGREYDGKGTLLREGSFAEGLLSGAGREYTASGALRYEGAFHRGQYDGAGALYREDGTMSYEGAFSRGHSDGAGTLYNEEGQAYYAGPVLCGAPRAAAFLGLSLAEVEAAFAPHWALYVCGGTTAFAYPAQGLLFVTEQPAPIAAKAAEPADVPSTEPSVPAEPAPLALASDADPAELVIAGVISVGRLLPGQLEPDASVPAVRGAADAREWFSDFATGEVPEGAAVTRAGPFVYVFTPTDGGARVSRRETGDGGTAGYRRSKEELTLRYHALGRDAD